MTTSAFAQRSQPHRARPTRVDLVGVPMDLGADRRGVDMGPSAIRYARLREGLEALGIATLVDHGNLPVPVAESNAAQAVRNAKYLPIILAVCDELSKIVEASLRDGGFPLVLGEITRSRSGRSPEFFVRAACSPDSFGSTRTAISTRR